MDRALAQEPRQRPIALRWITTPRYDLLCYIAPCLASYLLLWLNLGRGVDYVLIWWCWTLYFDGPHVFGTLNRTYLDRQEWAERGRLLRLALLWFLPGPALVFLGVLAGTKLPFHAFLLFASLWAYWHVVRQHYGFLALYQKKNGEPAGRANRVDAWVFYVLMVVPFVSLFPRNEVARRELVEHFGFPVQPSAMENAIHGLLYTLIFATVVVYVVKEVRLVARGHAWNAPKNLFLASCLPLHLVICLHPELGPKLHPLMFTVLVTLYHNFQYTGIVWYYSRNRYQGSEAKDRYGLAALVARRFVTYYAIAIAFTVALRYSHWLFNGNPEGPLMFGPNSLSQTSLGSGFTVTDLANAFWWGFAFQHYWLDQHIWRVSRDARLHQDLKLA